MNGLEDNPICEKCQEEAETAIHLMTTCPHYWYERLQHFGSPLIGHEDLKNIPTKKIMNYAQATGGWATIED